MSKAVPLPLETGKAEPLVALAALARIPSRPPAELDRVLDATEACVARYGLRRTSMTDIAREMRVARTTLYRQVASLEDALASVASRQFFRLLDELVTVLADRPGPQAFVDAILRTLAFARTNPIAARILDNEPELIGALITGGRLHAYLTQAVDLVTPLVEGAMTSRAVRAADPRLITELLMRFTAILVLVPPERDVETVVRAAVEPLLRPPRAGRRGSHTP